MKLSANAKEFVKAEVKSAFAEDLKKANAAVEAAQASASAKYKAFDADYVRLKVDFAKKVTALVAKHNLTVRKENGGEFSVHSVTTRIDGSYHVDLEDEIFNETSDDGPFVMEAKRKVGKVEADVKKAVAKALFEIEVHGKRDTIEQIVSDVIREIREDK